MKIRELQDYVKDRLNAVEALVQGGCKAFAEDTRSVYDESNQWISGGKKQKGHRIDLMTTFKRL